MEWRASHILVKEKGLAVELRKRLKSGGKFGALEIGRASCRERV